MNIEEYLNLAGRRIQEAADKEDRQECVRLCTMAIETLTEVIGDLTAQKEGV